MFEHLSSLPRFLCQPSLPPSHNPLISIKKWWHFFIHCRQRDRARERQNECKIANEHAHSTRKMFVVAKQTTPRNLNEIETHKEALQPQANSSLRVYFFKLFHFVSNCPPFCSLILPRRVAQSFCCSFHTLAAIDFRKFVTNFPHSDATVSLPLLSQSRPNLFLSSFWSKRFSNLSISFNFLSLTRHNSLFWSPGSGRDISDDWPKIHRTQLSSSWPWISFFLCTFTWPLNDLKMSVVHFKKLVVDETERLESLCDRWNTLAAENENIPEKGMQVDH